MAGTFALRLQVLSAINVDTQLAYFPGLDAYFVGVNLGGASTPQSDGTVSYISYGDCISLDGGPLISIPALPLGFRLLGSAITLRNYIGGGPGTIIGKLWQRVGVAPITDYARSISQDGIYGATQTLLGWAGGAQANNILSYNFTPTEIIDLFVTLILNLIVTDPTRFTTYAFKQLEFSGNYDIITWSWQIANGIDIGNDVKAFGDEKVFQISSGGGINGDINNIYSTATPTKTGPDLKGDFGTGSGSGVSKIVFAWTDNTGLHTVTVNNADFDEWTTIFISFFLPDTLPLGPEITVTVVSPGFPPIPIPSGGTGTQFSGSIKLGTIKILTTEASGIYKIVADKRNDTIYTDSPTSDDTAELAIPYPHGKTGFIGG